MHSTGLGTKTLPSPKQYRAKVGNPWFPYYAGYSVDFVEHVLSQVSGLKGKQVLDPWNGAGTTSIVARHLGAQAWGFDLNPAMTLVAKSRLLSRNVLASVVPLAFDVLAGIQFDRTSPSDPLCEWFSPTSAVAVRGLERSVHRVLVRRPCSSTDGAWYDECSALAAFFYLALFRTGRSLLSPFRTTNPAWIRSPSHPSARVRPNFETIKKAFLAVVSELAASHNSLPETNPSTDRVTLRTANSASLPLPDGSIDVVVASPPYCTRLDYAVATKVELAVLGLGIEDFLALRRQLMGTTSVSMHQAPVQSEWGPTCQRLLEHIQKHPSKSSSGYYWRTHRQYFHGLFGSIAELSRVLVGAGECTLVVQDSYYKELRTDLAQITIEMADGLGLMMARRADFTVRRSMSALQRQVAGNARRLDAIESVLQFTRAA